MKIIWMKVEHANIDEATRLYFGYNLNDEIDTDSLSYICGWYWANRETNREIPQTREELKNASWQEWVNVERLLEGFDDYD